MGAATAQGEELIPAQRTSEAARQVRTLIEDTENKIGAGDRLVKQSGESLVQIITSIGAISRVMEVIATASREQANGIDELNRAIVQIDASTQENASTVEEFACVSVKPGRGAQEPAGMVARFPISQGLRNRSGQERPVPRPCPTRTDRSPSSSAARGHDFVEL